MDNNGNKNFEVIETQEQLDAIIGERIKRAGERAEAKAAEKYNGWTSPEELDKIKETFNTEIAALKETTAKQKEALKESEKTRTDLAKTRIAITAGLDIKYADRLQGENEEEWKKDAEALAKDFTVAHQATTPPPLGASEPEITKDIATREQFAAWMEENANKK